MTVGEKIKYFRTKRGLTQDKLAELSGIHPVSIRKYETNAMVPQQNQVYRIAQALGVNTISLTGSNEVLKMDTAGNVMSVLLLLFNSGIFKLSWEDASLKLPDLSSVKITLNPVFAAFLSAGNIHDDTTMALDDLFFKVTKPNMFSDLLALYVHKEMLNQEVVEGNTEENNVFCKQLKAFIESHENWLQADPVSFDMLIASDLEINDQEKSDIISTKK